MNGRSVAGAVLATALVTAGVWALARDSGPRILWWEGRPVRWEGGRGVVYAPDGRLIEFTRGTRAAPLPVQLEGRSILEAAPGPRGVWLVDAGGAVLERRPDGTLRVLGRTPFDVPTLAPTSGGGLWAARSPYQFTFRPESTGAPTLVALDTALRQRIAAGAATVPANPFLSQLANAGHVLAMPDGGAISAPFVRDEVIRFDAEGRPTWRVVRGLAQATPDPRLIVTRGASGPDVQVDYAPVNLGLALGPDGRVYVLSTPRATTLESRLDALDPATGRVERTWRFGTGLPTIAADRRGNVRTPDPHQLLPETEPDRRDSFPAFDVPDARGGRLRLADLAGKVLLVNFWASWCGPCREELPALDSLARAFDPSRFAFVALSDDVIAPAARRFITARGFTFRVGLGGGELKAQYHYYVGLPHTVLVDAEGRIVRQWAGYGGPAQIREEGAAIAAELARPREHARHHM